MSFDVAATANFLRHKLRKVVAPVFDRIESQYLDWVTELSRKKVGNDSLDVSPLRLPSDIILRDLRVADAQGDWLKADTLHLTWSPLDLFSGKARIDLLQAETITVLRTPTPSTPTPKPSS